MNESRRYAMKSELSKAQDKVLRQMRNGSIIGELSDKVNGRYELFTPKPSYTLCKRLDYPFYVRTINKTTVFTFLTLGLIREDSEVAKSMLPFSRNIWYVFK